jgi:hypothetical protein
MKTKSTSSHRTRHTPQRTCLGCRQVKAKRELIRIVNTPDGNLEVDITGKKAGRGAYLCPTSECWEAGLKGNRLDHALHTSLSPAGRMQLMKYAEGQLKGVSSASGEKTG